jgi:TP901 family phage tail tape measure protein
MADITKTVEIFFGGKNELSGIAKDIDRDLQALEKSISSVTTPMAAAGEAVLKFSAALGTLVAVGLALAVKEAGEFAGKFGEISTLIKDTGEPIDQFRADILNYATGSAKGIADINQALYNAISAGVDYRNSLDFLNVSEQLSIAGRANLADSTKSLISVLNAYGASTDQASKYADIMFQTVRLGQTTLPELSEGLSKVTSLAAAAGVPFETVAAAIAELTVKGMPTATALTALRGALQGMIDPSKEAAALAKTLGLDFSASAVQSKGFETVLKDVMIATKGNTETLAQLFGNVRGLVGVLSLGTDGAAGFQRALTEMNNSAGSAAEAAAKVANEYENINTRLMNQIKVSLIEIGATILPGYGEAVTVLGKTLAGFREAMKAGVFDPLTDLFKVSAEDAKKFGDSFALNFKNALVNIDLTGLAATLDLLKMDFADAFKFDSQEAMTDAMQFVIDSLISLLDVLKGMGEGFAPLINFVKQSIDAFNGLDYATKESLGNLMAFSMQWKALGPVITLISYAMQADVEKSGQGMRQAFMLMEIGVDSLKTGFYTAAAAIVTAAYGIASALNAASFGTLVTDADLAKMRGWVDYLGDKMVTAADRTTDSVLSLNQSIYGTGTAMLEAKPKVLSLTEQLEKIPSDIRAKISVAMDSKATDDVKFQIAQALALGDYNQVKVLLEVAEKEAKEAADKLKAAAPAVMTTRVTVQADGTTIEETKDMITKTFPDGTVLLTNVGTKAHAASIAETKAAIDKAIPPEKIMEIQAKIDEANIKAQSDIVQKAIEWKAKIDIAQIEAAAQTIKAMFGSIDNTITSTGETLVGMFGVLKDMQGMGTGLIEQEIKRESARRDEALTLQKDLTIAQVDLLRQQVEAMKSGGAMIQIDGKGLQPHLEAFMFEILKQIQIKANAEGMKFLVGAKA